MRKTPEFKIMLTLFPTLKLQQTRINQANDICMHSTERLKFQLFKYGEYGIHRFLQKTITCSPFLQAAEL